MATDAARRRRSPQEVGRLIVDAAQTLFLTQGYEATSTKAIARAAGVAESVIFRRYENKSALFDDAVLTPFEVYVDEFTRRWRERPPGEVVPEDLAYEYIAGLHRLCHEHRDLLVMLVNARTSDVSDPRAARLVAVLSRHRCELADTVRSFTRAIGVELAVSPEAVVRHTLALVLGSALADGPSDDGEEQHRQTVAEITAFVLRGAGYTPDDTQTTAPSCTNR